MTDLRADREAAVRYVYHRAYSSGEPLSEWLQGYVDSGVDAPKGLDPNVRPLVLAFAAHREQAVREARAREGTQGVPEALRTALGSFPDHGDGLGVCPVCQEPQFPCPGGRACKNGHGF